MTNTEKQIKRLMIQYSRYVREERMKLMETKFKAIWELYINNMEEVSLETIKLIHHISKNHTTKKTYGSEYSKECYNMENRILARQEAIYED